MKYCVLLPILCLLVACTPEPTTDESLSMAREALAAKDYKNVQIILKNSLRNEPEQLTGRYLLGQANYHTGDFQGAKKEFLRAIELGYWKNDVAPYLLRTDLKLGQFNSISSYIDSSNDTPADSLMVELHAIKGIELMLFGDFPTGVDSLNQAIKLSSQQGTFYHSLAKTFMAGMSGQITQALTKSEELLAQDSLFDEALLLNANMQVLAQQDDAAKNSYQSYISKHPSHFIVQAHYISHLIKLTDYQQAEDLLARLLIKTPKSFLINELKSELEFRQQNYKLANEYANVAISVVPQSFKANLLAGLSQFKMGNAEMAYYHLTNIESRLNSEHFAYKVLLSLKFKLGYGDEAIKGVDNIRPETPEDFNLLTNASVHLIQSGNLQKALEYVEKLEQLDVNSARELSQRGVIKLSLEDESGLEDLKNAITLDPDFEQARVAILFRHIEQQELNQALAYANDWIAEKPYHEGGYLALGLVQLRLEQMAQAQDSFNKALSLNPRSNGARYNLMMIDIANQRFEQALTLNQQILMDSPTHQGAQRALLDIYPALADKQPVIDLTEKLYSQNLEDVNLLMLHAFVLEQDQQRRKALSELERQVEKYQNNDRFLLLLAQMYFRDKQYSKAELYATRLYELAPENLNTHLTLLIALESQEKYDKAYQQVSKTIEQFPHLNDFKLYQVSYLLLMEEFRQAELHLNKIDRSQVSEPLLLGVLLLQSKSLGDYQKARNLAEQLYERQPNAANAFQYAQMLRETKELALCRSVIDDAIEQYGESVGLLNLLAEVNVKSEPDSSVKIYQALVDREPNNYIYHNNLAWSAIIAKDYSLGIKAAEKAYQLAQNNPFVMDTLGVAKMKMGDYREAEELLESAYQLVPENSDISLHYAEILIYQKKLSKSQQVLEKQKESEEKKKLLGLIEAAEGV